MKITSVALLVFLSMFAPVSASESPVLASGKPVMLFFCFGQSNMAGGGGMSDYNAALPNARLPRNDIWLRASEVTKDTGKWVPLGEHGVRGPEVSFAVKMAEAFPDYTIAILKVSRGATPIEFWIPGEPTQYNSREGYLKLDKVIPEVVADLASRVKTGAIPSFKVAGFVWMQGEGNANGVQRADWLYYKQLGALLDFVNAKAGTEKIPLVLGRISIQLSPAVVRESGGSRVSKGNGGNLPDNADFVDDGQRRGPVWYEAQLHRVRTEQEAFCADYPKAAWVDIDDLPLRDGYHYNPAGYTVMGDRFASAMLKLIAPAQ